MSILLFLKRIRHCAGFGVQSPTDYAFVREVIYQRSPYYAYEDIKASFEKASKRELWQARLLLRVANHAQADNIVYCNDILPQIDEKALHEGCRKTDITLCGNKDELQEYTKKDGTWFVIPGIYKGNADVWKEIQGHEHIVAFDLYHLAIAFVDMKRYAEVHIINPY